MNYSDPYEILREKVSLLDYLTSDRIAIVHRSVIAVDNARERLIRAKSPSRLVTVGDSQDDDVHLAEVSSNRGVVEGIMSVFGSRYCLRLSHPAKHFAENAMFAAAASHVLGLSVADAFTTLTTFKPSDHRMARWRVSMADGAIELIDDCYNAAPKSVRALLDVLAERHAARRRFLFWAICASSARKRSASMTSSPQTSSRQASVYLSPSARLPSGSPPNSPGLSTCFPSTMRMVRPEAFRRCCGQGTSWRSRALVPSPCPKS